MKYAFWLLALTISGQALASPKDIVRGFYETAFVKHQPELAMKTFVGETYIQHNPFVGDGPQPFIDYFVPYYKKNPEARTEIKRIIAEGDIVVVHAHSRASAKDRGIAAIDIFRVKNDKIVEHWDAVQPVAENPANKNTQF